MKKLFFLLIILAIAVTTTSVSVNANDNYKTIRNKMFAIFMPNNLTGTYFTKTTNNSISVYHKESSQKGFGGFAFGIKAYKNPSDHAVMPGSKKIGELTDKKGYLYDMVLIQPTDVQYDYTVSPIAPEGYKNLYDLAKSIKIEGVKSSKYLKDSGMKGENLYSEILNKHITAIKEKWDSTKLEKENMSYMYNVLSASGKNVSDKIGYAYYDINADGIDELVIGEIADGAWKGIIYDIYTMVDRKPAHVVSRGSRNRYYVCDDSFVCNEYSSGAMESGTLVYILVENSTELFPQVGFKYDAYTNKKNPWFLSYSSNFIDDKWENVSEKIYNERKEVFNRYERFDFIPLSKFK